MIVVGRGAGGPVTGPSRAIGWWGARRAARMEAEWAVALGGRVSELLAGLGLRGTVTSVRPDPDPVVVVRAAAGEGCEDYSGAAARLRWHLGCGRVVVAAAGAGWVRLELLRQDPLDRPVGVPAGGDMLLGVGACGETYRVPVAGLPHIAVQGQTGAGKTTALAGLVVQVLQAGERVAVLDGTGLLTRPLRAAGYGGLLVGAAGPQEHAEGLAGLVGEMERRVAGIPEGADVADDGQLVVVVDELAGLLGAAVDVDGGRRGGVGEGIRRSLGRLLAEGRKARMSMVLATQRWEAGLLSGHARGQAAIRVSLRVDNADSVELLHPGGRGEAAEHAAASAGIALLTAPGVPLARVRVPCCGEDGYAAYCSSVRRVAAAPVAI